MTRVLAKELRGRNVTVNAIAPGPTATDLFLGNNTQESIDRLTKLAPLERLGRPDDIANAVAFLAGPEGGGSMARFSAPMAALSDLLPPTPSQLYAFDLSVYGEVKQY